MSNVVTAPPTKKSGYYDKGFRHSEGGIKVTVDGTKAVEVEFQEYKMCREVLQKTKAYEFKQKTNKQILDAIFQDNQCTFEIDKAKSKDFILCRLVVLDKTKRDISGTAKEIINVMQADHSCNLTDDASEKTSHKLGGAVAEVSNINDLIDLLEDTLKDIKKKKDSASKKEAHELREQIDLLKETSKTLEEEYEKEKNKKEFLVKYIKKDRLHLRKSMRGMVKTWIVAKDRKEAEEIVKDEKEFDDFGELVSIVATKNKYEVGGEINHPKRIAVINTDITALLLADKSGGFPNPTIQVLDMANLDDPGNKLSKSVLLVVHPLYADGTSYNRYDRYDANNMNPDFIGFYSGDILGAIVPENAKAVQQMLDKHSVGWNSYDEANNTQAGKLLALSALAEIYQHFYIDDDPAET